MSKGAPNKQMVERNLDRLSVILTGRNQNSSVHVLALLALFFELAVCSTGIP